MSHRTKQEELRRGNNIELMVSSGLAALIAL